MSQRDLTEEWVEASVVECSSWAARTTMALVVVEQSSIEVEVEAVRAVVTMVGEVEEEHSMIDGRDLRVTTSSKSNRRIS